MVYAQTFPLETLVKFYVCGWRTGYLESYEDKNKFARIRQIGGNPTARRLKVLVTELEYAR